MKTDRVPGSTVGKHETFLSLLTKELPHGNVLTHDPDSCACRASDSRRPLPASAIWESESEAQGPSCERPQGLFSFGLDQGPTPTARDNNDVPHTFMYTLPCCVNSNQGTNLHFSHLQKELSTLPLKGRYSGKATTRHSGQADVITGGKASR